MIVERFSFTNEDGHELAAVLDRPAGEPRAYALFAHCFTCGKDVLAARRIAGVLTEHGLGVVRFDFTGLGASEGEFGAADFSSNISDLLAAAAAMRERGMAPALLIGHSLGGAAVLAAAAGVPEAVAVATIAAPFEPGHIAHLFDPAAVAEARAEGSVEVTLAGRPFRVTRQFLDDIAGHRLEQLIHDLDRALLVFHAPEDEVVGIENAARIFGAAKHPKSFISLLGSDHLLTRPADAAYVAGVLAAGVDRYLPQRRPAPAEVGGEVVVAETGFGRFQQAINASGHRLYADEPEAVGGTDTGPNPYELLLAGVGACTAMTVRLYAERKGWPLQQAEVRLRHDRDYLKDCETAEAAGGRMERITRTVILHGPLDDEQRARLLEMAERCPVHRTLEAGVHVETTLAPRDP
jgi:putative redox protein